MVQWGEYRKQRNSKATTQKNEHRGLRLAVDCKGGFADWSDCEAFFGSFRQHLDVGGGGGWGGEIQRFRVLGLRACSLGFRVLGFIGFRV